MERRSGNASGRKRRAYNQLTAIEKQIKQKVQEMLEEAERVESGEDARYGRDGTHQELPPELANHAEADGEDPSSQAAVGRGNQGKAEKARTSGAPPVASIAMRQLRNAIRERPSR